jgi:hypothetical protein
MDSPLSFCAKVGALVNLMTGIGQQKESTMNTTTVAVDLAKSVFQLAVADSSWRVIEQRRLTQSQFERWFINPDEDEKEDRPLTRCRPEPLE